MEKFAGWRNKVEKFMVEIANFFGVWRNEKGERRRGERSRGWDKGVRNEIKQMRLGKLKGSKKITKGLNLSFLV